MHKPTRARSPIPAMIRCRRPKLVKMFNLVSTRACFRIPDSAPPPTDGACSLFLGLDAHAELDVTGMNFMKVDHDFTVFEIWASLSLIFFRASTIVL